jgi:hypothetical protein
MGHPEEVDVIVCGYVLLDSTASFLTADLSVLSPVVVQRVKTPSRLDSSAHLNLPTSNPGCVVAGRLAYADPTLKVSSFSCQEP